MRDAAELRLRREVAIEAARAATEVHMRHRGQDLALNVHGKEAADYATKVDIEAEDAVRQVIARRFPDETVIGEEDDTLHGRLDEFLESGCWLTDPLDGTGDFVHGSPDFSAIVSYVEAGEPLVAAVYFPVRDELFSAAAGQAATLNDQPIHVSKVKNLKNSMLSMAFRSTDPERIRVFTQRIVKMAPHIEGLRLPGAPSVMACSVACGYFDVFTMHGQLRDSPPPGRPFFGSPWETAAFMVLIKEAGGAMEAIGGGPASVLGYNVFAASQELITQLAAVMAD